MGVEFSVNDLGFRSYRDNEEPTSINLADEKTRERRGKIYEYLGINFSRKMLGVNWMGKGHQKNRRLSKKTPHFY